MKCHKSGPKLPRMASGKVFTKLLWLSIPLTVSLLYATPSFFPGRPNCSSCSWACIKKSIKSASLFNSGASGCRVVRVRVSSRRRFSNSWTPCSTLTASLLVSVHFSPQYPEHFCGVEDPVLVSVESPGLVVVVVPSSSLSLLMTEISSL